MRNQKSRKVCDCPPGTMLSCKKCGKDVPAQDFPEFKRASGPRYSSYCTACYKVMTAERYYAAHPVLYTRREGSRLGIARKIDALAENSVKDAGRAFCEINGIQDRPASVGPSGRNITVGGELAAVLVDDKYWGVIRFCLHGIRDEYESPSSPRTGKYARSIPASARDEDRAAGMGTAEVISAAFKKFMMDRGLYRTPKERERERIVMAVGVKKAESAPPKEIH